MPVSTSPPALLSVGGDSAGLSPAGAALAWPGRGLPLAAQDLGYPPSDPACRAYSYATTRQFPERTHRCSFPAGR